MRLIDVDEFKKQDILEQLRTAEFDDEIKDAVEKIPIAYDTDKVVEQIDNIMKDESIRFCEQAVNVAKKIVKSGGVADE